MKNRLAGWPNTDHCVDSHFSIRRVKKYTFILFCVSMPFGTVYVGRPYVKLTHSFLGQHFIRSMELLLVPEPHVAQICMQHLILQQPATVSVYLSASSSISCHHYRLSLNLCVCETTSAASSHQHFQHLFMQRHPPQQSLALTYSFAGNSHSGNSH